MNFSEKQLSEAPIQVLQGKKLILVGSHPVNRDFIVITFSGSVARIKSIEGLTLQKTTFRDLARKHACHQKIETIYAAKAKELKVIEGNTRTERALREAETKKNQSLHEAFMAVVEEHQSNPAAFPLITNGKHRDKLYVGIRKSDQYIVVFGFNGRIEAFYSTAMPEITSMTRPDLFKRGFHPNKEIIAQYRNALKALEQANGKHSASEATQKKPPNLTKGYLPALMAQRLKSPGRPTKASGRFRKKLKSKKGATKPT